MQISRKFFKGNYNEDLYISYDTNSSDLVISKLLSGKLFGIDNSLDALRFIGIHDRQQNPAGTVIDCGCHIGTFAIPLYDIVKEVICIDGSEKNIKCLEDTLLQDMFYNIRTKCCILDKESRKCSFEDSGPFGSINFEDENRISDTLDNIIGDTQDDICLIKYDLEGSEINAIKGSNKTIQRHRPYIITEVNPLCLDYHGSTSQELFDIIDDYDYDIFMIKTINIYHVYYLRIQRHHINSNHFPKGSVNDFFCVPREKTFKHDCPCGICFNHNAVLEL